MHIDMKYQIAVHNIEKYRVKLQGIAFEGNVAHLMTKSLGQSPFSKLREEEGVMPQPVCSK